MRVSGVGGGNPELPVLTDADISPWLSPASSIVLVEEELRKAGTGPHPTPARVQISLGSQTMVVGAGLGSARFGARLYMSGDIGDDITVLWGENLLPRAIIVGTLLGEARVGALGAVAARQAVGGTPRIGAIGTGAQARAQLLHLAELWPNAQLSAWSRGEGNREAFRAWGEENLLDIKIGATPNEVAETCNLLVVATSSETPVIDVSALRSVNHINAIGPKSPQRHDLPAEVGDWPEILTTDSLVQFLEYPGGTIFDHRSADVLDLASGLGGLNDRAKSLYVSVGRSGIEVALAHSALDAMSL